MEPSTPDAPPQQSAQRASALRSKDSSTYEYRTVRIHQNSQQQVIYSSSTSSTSSHSSASMLSSSTNARGATITSNVDQPYQQLQQQWPTAQFNAASKPPRNMLMATSMMRPNPAITLLGVPGGVANFHHQRCSKL
uniref:Uncharacterized protein n=1 Tax=Anopheles maculatus TaxID=74869 RepID=A0A182T1R7_9DIPT